MNDVAIVTGGAKRIGRAIALMLARRGYDIILHYNASIDEAENTAKEIEASGRRCYLLSANFDDMTQVLTFIPHAYEISNNCNLLINSASIFERARLLDTDEDLFNRHFNVNFKTPFFLSRDFARFYKLGQIINILDTKISKNMIAYFAYTLTKKALYEFTKMAAKELAPNIRVNGIGPGLILPPPGQDESYLDEKSRSIPLNRKGNLESIESAISFLIDNDFITGECIFIDGGEHLI